MSSTGTILHGGIESNRKDCDIRRGVITVQGKPTGRLLFAQTVDSSPVTNTAVETAFDQKAIIPAGSLSLGDAIRIRSSGTVTSTNANDVLEIKLAFTDSSLGVRTTIQATGDFDVSDNDIWIFDTMVTIESPSGGFVVFRQATLFHDLAAPGSTPIFNNSSGISTGLASAEIKIGSTASWDNADPGNSCFQESLTVELFEGWPAHAHG